MPGALGWWRVEGGSRTGELLSVEKEVKRVGGSDVQARCRGSRSSWLSYLQVGRISNPFPLQLEVSKLDELDTKPVVL